MLMSAFYTIVSGELQRGTSLDSIIPQKVADAVKFIERTHTFKHMERFVTFTLDPTQDYPRTYSCPQGLKSVVFMRIVLSDGRFKYLPEVDPKDVLQTETKVPNAYWQDGMDYFWLDNTPDEEYDAELSANVYTTLPAANVEAPWIINNWSDLVLAQTMVEFGPKIRDEKVIAYYKGQREEKMQGAVLADAELREKNAPAEMIYAANRLRP
jgi:hypothetical protein